MRIVKDGQMFFATFNKRARFSSKRRSMGIAKPRNKARLSRETRVRDTIAPKIFRIDLNQNTDSQFWTGQDTGHEKLFVTLKRNSKRENRRLVVLRKTQTHQKRFLFGLHSSSIIDSTTKNTRACNNSSWRSVLRQRKRKKYVQNFNNGSFSFRVPFSKIAFKNYPDALNKSLLFAQRRYYKKDRFPTALMLSVAFSASSTRRRRLLAYCRWVSKARPC